MTESTVTDERLGLFARKQHDWFERVKKGSLNPEIVERAIQEIIDIAPRGKYASEEVASSYGYPEGYAVKSLAIQITALTECFELKGGDAMAYAENLPELPKGAEGWFAIPKWKRIVCAYGSSRHVGYYAEAVKRVFWQIAQTRKFQNLREEKLGINLMQSTRTDMSMYKIAKTQKGDILIIPAQVGLRHRGKSMRRVCEIFTANEFGLGAFAVGCIILTHQERLVQNNQVYIDCPGDEYRPDTDGDLSDAPFFSFDDDTSLFATRRIAEDANARFGAATGFVV